MNPSKPGRFCPRTFLENLAFASTKDALNDYIKLYLKRKME